MDQSVGDFAGCCTEFQLAARGDAAEHSANGIIGSGEKRNCLAGEVGVDLVFEDIAQSGRLGQHGHGGSPNVVG